MAEAAIARGLSYLTITDHSKAVGIGIGLDADKTVANMKLVQKAAKPLLSKGFYLLTGIEVDIMPGGLLDLPDEVLAEWRNLDALLLDEESRSDTYPTIRIGEDDVDVGHEATVSKVGDEQLFYLMSHGISEEEAGKLIVNGFIEPIVKELPMEYAVEMNNLIRLEMKGSIG